MDALNISLQTLTYMNIVRHGPRGTGTNITFTRVCMPASSLNFARSSRANCREFARIPDMPCAGCSDSDIDTTPSAFEKLARLSAISVVYVGWNYAQDFKFSCRRGKCDGTPPAHSGLYRTTHLQVLLLAAAQGRWYSKGRSNQDQPENEPVSCVY